MNRLLALIAFFSLTIQNVMSREVSLTVVQTSDVHGSYFPYDFIARKPLRGSLARVDAYVDSLRRSQGADRIILLDGGDMLQGQPTAYYYNFIDTVSPHLAASVMNFMGYDAAVAGNHDIETGHSVYDRWRSQLRMPLLGGNVTRTATGDPYFLPYTILERDGVKVMVVGLVTPAVPAWLPENLWSGMEFHDMVLAAKVMMPEIIEKEKPDVVIGLFHSGRDESQMTGSFLENASLVVARQADGFDAVMFGHDHTLNSSTLLSDSGARVVALNPANGAGAVSRLDITLSVDDSGRVTGKSLSGSIVSLDSVKPSERFLNEFKDEFSAVDHFVSRTVGRAEGDFSTRDAFFGPSAFMSLLHELQLEISGADVSLAAPLSFDAVISRGPITVADMFKLYKYENMLYTMRLTGREIKDYLEFSYSLWTSDMNSPDDHILLFAHGDAAKGDYARLRNPAYNFDSAAGINYTVDVTKPRGQKVEITSFSDGRPFDPDSTYTVAINSYRGNGGGDLLTKGAGIPSSELQSRIVSSTYKDLRYYLMQAIERRGVITPSQASNWRFIPDSIVAPAIARDRKILFPDL